jgi:hypothetical protein
MILCYLICSLRCEAKITTLEGAIGWRTTLMLCSMQRLRGQRLYSLTIFSFMHLCCHKWRESTHIKNKKHENAQKDKKMYMMKIIWICKIKRVVFC